MTCMGGAGVWHGYSDPMEKGNVSTTLASKYERSYTTTNSALGKEKRR